VEPHDFTDDQRQAMLKAIHERAGRWDRVDPDTEVAGIGGEIGLSKDASYELFGHSLTRVTSILVAFSEQEARCRATPAA